MEGEIIFERLRVDLSESSKGEKASNSAADDNGVPYRIKKVIGNGSFGVVFEAENKACGEVVAIKEVLQDRRFKNRELHIIKMLSHRNVVQLKEFFYSSAGMDDGVYLNLVLEFVPETLNQVSRQYTRARRMLPLTLLQVYTFQMLRSLWYIHSKGICHRDIKPQNLLLDPRKQVLKLCDFGSAKILVKNEANISYICSRFYRAPELIFGATHYTTAVDVWSAGCVMAELMLGYPLFPGQSCVDQLVRIIKVLGTPSPEDIEPMNKLAESSLPQIASEPWKRIFRDYTSPEAIDLVDKLLRYNPSHRISPCEAMAHKFFDPLRDPNTRLPNGNPLPELFDFSEGEFKSSGRFAKKILPEAVYEELSAKYGNGISQPAPALEVSLEN